jgi:hypothetical protein
MRARRTVEMGNDISGWGLAPGLKPLMPLPTKRTLSPYKVIQLTAQICTFMPLVLQWLAHSVIDSIAGG